MADESRESPFGSRDICSATIDIRTKYVGINNSTQWIVEFAQFRCIDESNQVPAGFSADSNWFLGVNNVAGPNTTIQDICVAIQRPIQATRVKCNYRLRWPGAPDSGTTLNAPDLSDGDTTSFYDHAVWQIAYTGKKTANGFPDAELRLVKMKISKNP
jgi:hypothetical protein